VDCPTCKGFGHLMFTRRVCTDSGSPDEYPVECEECGGSGKATQEEDENVDDLSKHLFDVGCTMNRAQAEMAHVVATEPNHDARRYCPVEIVESLLRYWHDRTPTGDFLRAVLANDLTDAVYRADDTNVRCLAGIVRFIYEQLPHESWGSRAKVQAWLDGDGK
jgi:hypothetical protein